MNTSRVALLAAGACVAAWGLKAVAIGVAGGLDESPLEGPLFMVGLVAVVVAYVSLGASVATQRPLAVKVLCGLAGLVLGLGLTALMSTLAAAAIPSSAGWVQAEAGLWFLAVLTLGLTAYWNAKRDTTHPARRPPRAAV